MHEGHGHRRVETADLECPAVGVHPEHDDVADPVRVPADDAEQVIDRLAVRPGFHEPRGDGRADAHGRPGPGHACRRIRGAEALRHGDAEAAPAFEQRASREPLQPLRFERRQAACADVIRHGPEERQEGVAIRQRQVGRPVPHVQVAENVVDGPALERRRLLEVPIGQPGQQSVQRFTLGQEIGGLLHHHRLPSPLRAADLPPIVAASCCLAAISRRRDGAVPPPAVDRACPAGAAAPRDFRHSQLVQFHRTQTFA